jgi:SNF2 family DNA or RNA helicase
MGLGKTIQTISLIAYRKEYKNNLGRRSVVDPVEKLGERIHKMMPVSQPT